LKRACSPATSDEAREKVAARELPRDQGVMPQRNWRKRFAQIPVQSQQCIQSHCEANGYISSKPGFSQTEFASTDVAKARVMLPLSGRVAGISMSRNTRSNFMANFMAKASAPTTTVDISKYTKASDLSERVMKTTHKIAIASAVAFSAFAFTATPGSAITRSPATIPPGRYCLSYNAGGFDCSFTSYAQCEATDSGQSAECYGNTPADDQDPWNTRSQQFPRRHF
jgi:hypothetical protein